MEQGAMVDDPLLPLDIPHAAKPAPPRKSRPSNRDADIVLMAAKHIVATMINGSLIAASDSDYAAEDLAKCWYEYDDGYQFARKLENRCSWDCNMQIAEALDDFSHVASNIVENLTRQWVIDHDIKPPFAVGMHVLLTKSRGETGVITEISPYLAATYHIAIDGDAKALAPTNSRRIVAFEDVEQIQPIPPNAG
jgi:hypothetical protein